MTPLGWFFIGLMFLATLISVSIAWHASPPVDLRGILARLARPLRRVPVAQKHTGHHRAGAPLVIALPAAQVIAQADAIHRLMEPYAPPVPHDPYGWMAAPSPQDGPVYRSLTSYMQAGRAVEIPETPDKPPWMITTNALDAVPATDQGTKDLYFGGDLNAGVLAAEALPAATGPERVIA